ncbi:MAG: type II toxin-antitoxin system VapC family toxin [Geminicoccaceae bacterium]
MVVDSSALLAIALLEPEARQFTDVIQRARLALLSAANFVEASILVQGRRGQAGLELFDAFVQESGIRIEPVTRAQALLARDAYRRFGKGNHPAGLKFGDCFAYALARERDLPLLFKGDDFARSDIRPAV